jgi:hypothetical protein
VEAVGSLTILGAAFASARTGRESARNLHAWRREITAVRPWLSSADVVGVARGPKRVGDRCTATDSLIVFVRRKQRCRDVSARRQIPPRLDLDWPGGEATLDVQALGAPLIAHAGPGPLRPGIIVTHKKGAPGTLGVLVRRNNADGVFMLSCSHVIACSGFGVQTGDAIGQPAVVDNDPASIVGSLAGDFSILRKQATGHVNMFDVALARLHDGLQSEPGPLPGVPGPTAVAVRSDDAWGPHIRTLLHGAVNSEARGRVRAFDAQCVIEKVFNVGTAIYGDVVMYDTRCSRGDSGAAVLSPDGSTLLGVHVAGSEDGVGVFQPAGRIFKKFGLTLAS